MSANLVVDIANTCVFGVSIPPSVASAPTSGVFIGNPIDLKDANTQMQVWAVGGASSGILVLQVQTAPAVSGLVQSGGMPPSGTFTDPTSGYVDFPGQIKSGGLIYINSGNFGLPGDGGASGTMGVNTFPYGLNPNFNGQGGGFHARSGDFPVFGSGGGMAWAAWPRPDRFVRVNILGLGSGFTGLVAAGVLSQSKVTGSGGGFTFAPQTGAVNV